MKKIYKKDIKAGDFIYLIYRKWGGISYVMEIVKIINKSLKEVKWWGLKNTKLFNFGKDKGIIKMPDNNWKYYELFKLNKQETLKLRKHLILQNLK